MINLLFLLGDVLKKGFIGIILTLDTLIYGLVSSAFKIFMAIASARLLSSEAYYTIANKVYLIIGVLMLFVLSYAMLKAIVNPDEGKKSFGPGIIKRIVIAVIGLAIAPALFNLMYQVQGLVLEHNVLGRIFFRSDNTQKTDASSITVGGQTVNIDSVNPDNYIDIVGGSVTATTIWQAFFYPAPDSGKNAEDIIGDLSDYYLTNAGMYGVACAVSGYVAYAGYAAGGYGYLVGLLGTAVGLWTCSEAVSNVVDAIGASGQKISLAEAYTLTAKGESFGLYTIFIDAYYEDGEISYLYGISTIAGAFTLYAFVSFSIDMGVRAAKLAYYQIVAPVPLIMQVLPGKGESTFKEYTHSVINTFLEVFIRIAVVYIVVYIICHLQDLFSSVDALWGNHDLTSPEVMLAMAFLIIGLIIFCKEAPKFLSKTLGIDGGNLHLGLGKKLADGGAYTAASAIGGGVTAGVNNLTNTINRWRDPNKWRDKDGNLTFGSVSRNLIGGITSPFAGAVSGAVRGGVAGKDAKTLKDVQRGAATGALAAKKARDAREAYADNHPDGLLFGANSVMVGHVGDLGKTIVRWAGIDDLEGLEKQEQALKAIESAQDALKSKAKSVINSHADGNKVKSYGITVGFNLTDFNSGKVGTARFSNSDVAGLDGTFSTAVYKQIKDGVERARANGDGMFAGHSISEWDALRGKYEADFADELQNMALLSDAEWNGTSTTPARVAFGDKADIGAVRDLAVEFRGVLSDNLGNAVIGVANSEAERARHGAQKIDSTTVATASLIVNNDSAIKKLGDAVSVTRQEIVRKKQEIRKKEDASGGGGGKK